jgi:hypothetical protein
MGSKDVKILLIIGMAMFKSLKIKEIIRGTAE